MHIKSTACRLPLLFNLNMAVNYKQYEAIKMEVNTRRWAVKFFMFLYACIRVSVKLHGTLI